MEVLISMGLFTMVLLGVYCSLTLALRFQTKLSDTTTVFERGLRASSRMSYDLGTGSSESVVVEPNGFAFVSARLDSGVFTHDPHGSLEWHGVIFYYLEEGNLMRGELPFPATSTPVPLGSIQDLIEDEDARKAILVEGVEELTLTVGSGATTILSVRGDDEKKRNLITLESRVTFRN